MATVNRYQKNDLNFVQSFLGLVFRPLATVEKLFKEPRPHHAVGLILIFLLTVLVPAVTSVHIHGKLMYQPLSVVSLLLVLILTLIYFVFIESFFLTVFSVNVSISGLAQAVVFCLAPLTVIIWGMYAINYITNGTLTLVTFVLSGEAALDDKFINAVPYIINIGFFVTLLILHQAIRLMGDLFFTNAFILALFSIFPLHLALILAVLSANAIQPGTIDIFIQLIYAPASLVLGGS